MPTKDYINGSDKFQILLINSVGTTETLDFSFNFTALYEYDLGIATRHKFRPGNKRKKMHHLDLFWEIDFSGILFNPDAKLINRVKNAEFEEKSIVLIPHTDNPLRAFRVQIVEKERKLGQYYNIDKTGANKDYNILFENVEAINRYNWSDAEDIPLMATGDYLIIN